MSLGEQLYDAAKSGGVEAVERLLDKGADIEYVGSVSEVLIIYLFIYLFSANYGLVRLCLWHDTRIWFIVTCVVWF